MLEEGQSERKPNTPSGEKKPAGATKRRRRPYREWRKKPLVPKDGNTGLTAKQPSKAPRPMSAPEKARSVPHPRPAMENTASPPRSNPVPEKAASAPRPVQRDEKKPVQRKSYHNRGGTANRRPKQRTDRFQDFSAFEGIVEMDFSNLFFQEHAQAIKSFTGEVPVGLRNLKFPGVDTKVARERIVAFIKEQFEHSGKQSVCLGISGGLDSAVTAALVMAALGREKVRFVHFIETEKSAATRARADLISRGLKNQLAMHDLRPRLQNSFTNGSGLVGEKKKKIARVRMLALYELADANNALVIGSMNKTKRLLGYGTRFGDLAYDINPLEDVYLSQLIELARVLNVPKVIQEQSLLVEAPYRTSRSAELVWKEVDYYLYQIADVRISLAHLRKIGMDENKLLWIYHCMQNAVRAGRLAPRVDLTDATIPRSGGL
ncbi:NAD(+) synthase [bacterium]|nr:NAD(+) synthase [bacterium]